MTRESFSEALEAHDLEDLGPPDSHDTSLPDPEDVDDVPWKHPDPGIQMLDARRGVSEEAGSGRAPDGRMSAHLQYNPHGWALDVFSTLLVAHRVLLKSDDVSRETARAWWDAAVHHEFSSAGSRPPMTLEEMTQARRTYRVTCARQFRWDEKRALERELKTPLVLQAGRVAAVDCGAADEAWAKPTRS